MRVGHLTRHAAFGLASALVALARLTTPLSAQTTAPAAAPPSTEVRQIVTFRWLPGRDAEATAVYIGPLRAIYERVPAIGRVRIFREAESPEPLDLVVVTSYASMAQMDTANAQLRGQSEGGRRALQFYADLSALSSGHHDQFVEMLPHLAVPRANPGPTRGSLMVYEYLRAAPGAAATLERELDARVVPAERNYALRLQSESGRFLVSDGWTHLRVHVVPSLGAWQAYVGATRQALTHERFERQIASRKIIILRHLPDADVR